MILIIGFTDRRLCNDKKFRSFAHFGTTPECVKVYKSIGGAKRGVRWLNHKSASNGARVVVIPDDHEMNVAGVVTNPEIDANENAVGMYVPDFVLKDSPPSGK